MGGIDGRGGCEGEVAAGRRGSFYQLVQVRHCAQCPGWPWCYGIIVGFDEEIPELGVEA